MNVFDITRTLGSDTLQIPGDPPFGATRISAIERGEISNLSYLTLSSHSGTHLDSPNHFFDHLPTLDQLPIGRFMLDAAVIEILHPKQIERSEIELHRIFPGMAVLFKTQNRFLSRDVFSDQFVDLSEAAARWLVDRKVAGVGIDYPSIEQFGDETFSVHRILLANDILILEDIDLARIAPGAYRLVCLPLKFQHADGAPCRAILLQENSR